MNTIVFIMGKENGEIKRRTRKIEREGERPYKITEKMGKKIKRRKRDIKEKEKIYLIRQK